jgi:sugar lactone lactonase YvrE
VSLALVLAVLGAALPSQYVIPGDNVFPEGVTLRPGTDQFFVSSTTTGTVYRGTLGKPRMKAFLAPGEDGRALSTGLRASRDHLVVAGSVTGYIFIYDVRTGRLVRRFATGSGGLINDVAIAPDGDVYTTDSMRGLLFRVSSRAASTRTGKTTRLKPFLDVGDTPIGGAPNGIVPAGRRYLLVVGLGSGVLGRVDLETKQVRAVKGVTFVLGDGLARTGHTLYAVNSASRVTQATLSRNWLSGTVVRQITSPSFLFPTTVQIAGRRLLVVNSQFDKRSAGAPVLPFTVAAVRRP